MSLKFLPVDKTSPSDTPVFDSIPGLRGSPVRTPVRTVSPDVGFELWPAIAGRLLSRQLWIELYGLPGYSLTLATRKISAFATSPRDFRPLTPDIGKSILSGRLTLAGVTMDLAQGEHPWNRPSPSRAFANHLHAFDWLRDLMAQGDRGAREALRLTLLWETTFKRWSPFAWGPELLARRVYHLSCAAKRMGAVATEAERVRLATLLARQTRQLLRPPGGQAGKAERLASAAISGCVLAGPVGARLRRTALNRLSSALKTTVAADGAHGSRSPEAGLELTLDLLTLQDALSQLSQSVPDPITDALSRLQSARAILTLPDGRLTSFQGGGPSTEDRVTAARDDDTLAARIDTVRQVGHYYRLEGSLLTIITDGGTIPQGTWGATACAQPLALEVVCGRDRLITGSGWTPDAAERDGLRLTPAHSTLTLGEESLAQPLRGWRSELLGPRLIGRPVHVEVEHRSADGAVWLDMEHDGWAVPYGLMHQRRLYLDQKLDELRAEERLHPAPANTGDVRAIAAPYAARFHLQPGVQASLARDKRSILLRGPSGRGWWFRSDAPDVAIEPSVHIEAGLTRRSLQIVARGSARTDTETRVRWKISPAGASSDTA